MTIYDVLSKVKRELVNIYDTDEIIWSGMNNDVPFRFMGCKIKSIWCLRSMEDSKPILCLTIER